MSSIITIAQIKLTKLVTDSSAAAVGRRVGSTGNTIRLLAAGAASPKVTTVERMRVLGIEPADWLTPTDGAECSVPLGSRHSAPGLRVVEARGA